MCLAAIKGQSTSLLPILFLSSHTSSNLSSSYFSSSYFSLSYISFPPPDPPPGHTVSGINNPLLFRLQKNSAEREEEGEKEEEGRDSIKEEGNVLNLSHQAQSDVPDDSLRWEKISLERNIKRRMGRHELCLMTLTIL